jgi:hypothetical protein
MIIGMRFVVDLIPMFISLNSITCLSFDLVFKTTNYLPELD